MANNFNALTLASTIAEGGTYSFTVTPSAALAALTTVRWEIVANGKIPISSGDVSALTGTLSFASGTTAAQPISFTATDDTALEATQNFEIRVYQVVTSGTDILIGSQDVSLTNTDAGSFGTRARDGTAVKNVLGAASTESATYNGLAGDDTYIVTRFQYGDVTISDIFDDNLIKFDEGVTITGFAEISGFGGRRVSTVDLTLSTGAVIKINAPAGKFDYQLGDGAVISSYTVFKTAIGATGTNSASALSSSHDVITFTTPPDVEGNPVDAEGNLASTGSRSIDGTGGDDVLGAANDFNLNFSGLAGDDVFVITRFQYGDVTISDIFDANLIKFDYGVTITGYAEVSGFGGRRVSTVSLTLDTGAVIKINAPAGKFGYQLGDDAVITTYAAFKTALDATGTNAASALLAPATVAFPERPTVGTVTVTASVDLSAPVTQVKVNETLTANTDGLSDTNDPTLTFTYQWKLGGTDIAGATSKSYTPTAIGSYTVAVGAQDNHLATTVTEGVITTTLTSAAVTVVVAIASSTIVKTVTYNDFQVGSGDGANPLDASAETGVQLIQGGALKDTIVANGAGDIIAGGYGADTITLGAGTDTTVYRFSGTTGKATDGGDTVNAFKLATDKFIFANIDGTSVTVDGASITEANIASTGIPSLATTDANGDLVASTTKLISANLIVNASDLVTGFQITFNGSGIKEDGSTDDPTALSGGRVLTVNYTVAQNAFTLLGITAGDNGAFNTAVDVHNAYTLTDTSKFINLFGGTAFFDIVDYSTPLTSDLDFVIL